MCILHQVGHFLISNVGTVTDLHSNNAIFANSDLGTRIFCCLLVGLSEMMMVAITKG